MILSKRDANKEEDDIFFYLHIFFNILNILYGLVLLMLLYKKKEENKYF